MLCAKEACGIVPPRRGEHDLGVSALHETLEHLQQRRTDNVWESPWIGRSLAVEHAINVEENDRLCAHPLLP